MCYYWLQILVLVLYWNCMELLRKGHRIVLVFYCQNKNDQNWYCYFIAKIKMFRIGIGILLLSKSLPCPPWKLDISSAPAVFVAMHKLQVKLSLEAELDLSPLHYQHPPTHLMLILSYPMLMVLLQSGSTSGYSLFYFKRWIRPCYGFIGISSTDGKTASLLTLNP